MQLVMTKLINSIFLILILTIANTLVIAQSADPKDTELWTPVPPIVTPGVNFSPPSDAIVLFDGSNLDAWSHANGSDPGWIITDDFMTVNPRTGGLQTKENFGDCQLHIEWRTPSEIKGEGQGRGNSGVFFQSRYELQVLDSYENITYPNGQAGSIYKQHIPLVNVSRKPGEWQRYDIIFMAPRFNAEGVRVRAGRLTVFHNGVIIQNNVEIKGTTEYIGPPKNIAHDKAPLMLQDHGNPVSYRNIWIRPLE